jgi:hypothetical protein
MICARGKRKETSRVKGKAILFVYITAGSKEELA